MRQGIIEKLNLKGFLSDYIAYASSLTDAPVEFHLGAGLTALASVCGSRIIFPSFGGRVAWPNLYTLLIAPSGFYRKSTSVGIAEDLVSEVNKDLILQGEQSREKFLAILKEQPQCLYPISEFSSVLSMWSRDYAMGFKEIVTDLYDNRSEYQRQTLKDGKTVIKKPALNILAASTIEWLKDKLTEGDLRGGLMGRFILIPGVNKTDDKGLNPENDKSKKEKLIEFLSSIYTIERAWVDMKSCLPDFNQWLLSMERDIGKNPNPELIGFQSRLGMHTLKLAVLITISEKDPGAKYIMDLKSLDRAMILSKWLLDSASEIAVTGFVKSKFEQQVQKLLNLSSRNGGVSREIALQLMHCSVKEFEAIVGAAVERNQLKIDKEVVDRKQKGGRPKVVYQAIIKEGKED